VSFPASPTAMGPSQDEGYSIPRRNIRPGQVAAPPLYGGFGCGGMGTRARFRGVSAHLDGIIRPARAVSSMAFVGPRSGDVLSPARGYHRVNGCRLRSDYCRPGRRLNSA
jgi:hypothetical protein